MYNLYLLRCSDNSLYCGITTSLVRRLRQHNTTKGSKYVRTRKPFSLVYTEEHPDIKSAMRRELQIKKWAKAKKEKLIYSQKNK
jgi:putative endonuclease